MLYVTSSILFINRLITASLPLTLWLVSLTALGQERSSGGVRALLPNHTLERTVTGSETHRYKLALRVNEFFQVRVEQKGADVVLRLVGAGGNELARMDSPNGKEGPETLSFVAAEPGFYMLEVGGLDPKAGKGKYTIVRITPRAATQQDRRRVEVERLFVAAGEQSARDQGAADPTDTGIKRWEAALAGWRELQDAYMMGLASRELMGSKKARAKALYDAATQIAKRRDEGSLKMSLPVLAEVRKLTHETGQQRGEALSLSSLAQVSWALGDKRKAVEYYEESLPVWLAVGDKAEEAEALSSLGKLNYELEDIGKALKYFLQAIDSFKATQDKRGEAAMLTNVGGCYSQLDDNVKAAEYLKQALPVWHASGDVKGEATALVSLAALRSEAGKKDEALDLYRQALSIYRDAKDRKGEADALRNIGNVYYDFEEPRQALEPYRQALSIYQDLDDKEGLVATLDKLGYAYVTLGDKAAGVEYFVQALPLYKFTEDDWKERRTLANLGSLYIDLGEKKKALESHMRGLELSREADDQLGVGTQLNNVGMVYMALGERRKARDEYFNEALKVFRRLKDRHGEAWTLVCLAAVQTELGDERKALENYEQALPLYRESKDKAGEVDTLHSIGVSYDELGDKQRALQVYEEGLNVADSDKQRSLFLLGIGGIYLDRGEKRKALDYQTRALVGGIGMRGGKEGDVVTLSSIGSIWRSLGNLRLAIFYGKQAINESQRLRQAIRDVDYETQKAYLRRVDSLYNSLAVSLIDAGRMAEAVQVINLYQDQQYFDSNRDPAGPAKRIEPSQREAALAARYERADEALTQVNWKLDDLALDIKDDKPTPLQAAQRHALEAEKKSAEDAFVAVLNDAEAEFSKPADGNDEVPPAKEVTDLQKTLRDIGASHGQKVVALYAVPDSERFNLLLVTPDYIKAFTSPVKAKDLDEKALRFYALLRSPRYDPRPLGKELYDVILKPAEAELKRTGARTLLWMLGGNLRYVPMAALSPDGKGYLVEHYQNVVFTRADREQLTRPVSRKWEGVGFGSSRAQKVNLLGTEFNFRGLKGVNAELRAIFGDGTSGGGILPGKVFKDDAFTRDAFYESLKARHPLVHISSHFLFRPGDGSRSFLLLGAGPPLTLDELKARGRLFDAVDLLTLSACNTAAQRPDSDGREIDGFAELAQRLGASAVMATLWPVSDNSTPRLMGDFYRLRQSGAGATKAEALRRAQLSLLEGDSQAVAAEESDAVKGASEPDVQIVNTPPGGTRGGDDDPRRDTGETVYIEERDARPYTKNPTRPYAHPYYWAPFVLFGNWQ